MSIGDVVRYVPGVTAHQGENNRDQVIIRGNSSSADFFVDGVRDDVQYYRDLYNLDRVEALKGPNAHDLRPRRRRRRRQPRHQGSRLHAAARSSTCRAASYGNKRFTADLDQPLKRQGGASPQRHVRGLRTASATDVDLKRYGITPTLTFAPTRATRRSRSATSTSTTRASPIAASPRSRAGPSTSTSSTYLRQSGRQPRRRADVESRLRHRRASGRRARPSAIAPCSATTTASYQNFVPGAVSRGQERRSRSPRTTTPPSAPNLFNQTDLTYARRRPARSATRCWPAPRSAASSPTTSATPASSTTPRHRFSCRSRVRRSPRR